MIFALEGQYKVMNRKTHAVKEAWLSGIHHDPLKINYYGKSNLVGFRFQPYGLFPFLSIPIYETVNEVEPLRTIWGGFYDELFEKISNKTKVENVFPLIDSLLLRKINEQKISQQDLGYI